MQTYAATPAIATTAANASARSTRRIPIHLVATGGEPGDKYSWTDIEIRSRGTRIERALMCSPVQRGSYAVVQTVRELARQAGLADLRGDRIDIVPDPTHLERTLGEIEDAPCGPRIPVPRLPDGTGIHQEPGPEPVDHREVRMAQDDERRAGRADDRFVRGPRRDVLVVVPRTPVIHGHEAFGHRAAGPVLQLFQIADARGRQVDPRPANRLGRQLIEPERLPADRGAVVVPADRSDVPLPQDLQHLVRPRVVSDEVSRHPDAIRGDAIDVGQDRLQCVKVRVDVRKDRESHSATERARSIPGSQHEMRILPRPWSGLEPCVWLTLFKVNISKDRGTKTMATPIDAPGIPHQFRPLGPSSRQSLVWCCGAQL